MKAFRILILFGDVACKGNIVDNGNNMYQITMSDTPVGSIQKSDGVWKIEGDIASIINFSDVGVIGKYIEKQYLKATENDKECSSVKNRIECDIDLFKIALNLKTRRSESFICKGCNIRAVYKDVNGCLFVARQEGKIIKLYSVNIEDLMG